MRKKIVSRVLFVALFLFCFPHLVIFAESISDSLNDPRPINLIPAVSIPSSDSVKPSSVPLNSVTDFLSYNQALSVAQASAASTSPYPVMTDERLFPVVTRVSQTLDKLGRVTSFKETITSPPIILYSYTYTVTRSNIVYVGNTNEISSYTENFEFRDSSKLRGRFAKGQYLLDGTLLYTNQGQQVVNLAYEVKSSQRVLFNPNASSAMMTRGGDTVLLGIGESHQVAGCSVTRYNEVKDASGTVVSFQDHVAGSLFHYKVIRSDVKKDAKTGVVTSYVERFYFYDYAFLGYKETQPLTGTYNAGQYLLQGTLPGGSYLPQSQIVYQKFSLAPNFRFYFDPTRDTFLSTGNSLFSGWGQSRTEGDLKVVRYREFYDKAGKLSGYEETIFNTQGTILYKRNRSSIVMPGDKIMSYTDSFVFSNGRTVTVIWSSTDGTAKVSGMSYEGVSIQKNFLIPNIKSDQDLLYSYDRTFLVLDSGGKLVRSTPILLQSSTLLVPQTPSQVFLKPGDQRLFVREVTSSGALGPETAWVIKGVNWYPGYCDWNCQSDGAPSNQALYFKWYKQDIALMKQMGINTVRLGTDFGSDPLALVILDEFYRNGIKVIMPVNTPKMGTLSTNLADVERTVRMYKNHPAILMWEIVGPRAYNEPSIDYESAARLIKSLDSSHLVSSPAIVPSADVISASGSLENLTSIRLSTSKPIFVNAYSNEKDWDNLIKFSLSAERTQGDLIGGCYANWLGKSSFGQPDNFLVDVTAHSATSLFSQIKVRYLQNYQPPMVSKPVITATSDAYGQITLNGQVVFNRNGYGGGGRGINVAVLDTHTGIRMTHILNFDTWMFPNKFGDLIAFINSLPNGSVIVFTIGDEGGFIDYRTGKAYDYGPIQQAYQMLEQLGSKDVRKPGYRGTWAMIVEKGKGVLAEGWNAKYAELKISATVPIKPDPGFGKRP